MKKRLRKLLVIFFALLGSVGLRSQPKFASLLSAVGNLVVPEAHTCGPGWARRPSFRRSARRARSRPRTAAERPFASQTLPAATRAVLCRPGSRGRAVAQKSL